MSDAFMQREVPVVRKRVHRLGLAFNYGLDEAGVRHALDRGVNYVFWPSRGGKHASVLREALQRDRERYVIATGPTLGFLGGSVRRTAERALKTLGTDYLDIFQLFWVGVTSALTEGTIAELVKLKESGKVRAIGISIHDRQRAGKLAEDSPLDLFMIRYNAAHPGAERDIFPHLAKRKPAVVAYTATAWRKLLNRPKGWDQPVPTAGDCYRFCLSNPHVDVTLTGPATRAELDHNLDAVEKGPLAEPEMAWIREFGKVVHDGSSKLMQAV
jgi:aryl-alcohol dehydrogenase-like predicted oxidoreductase